MSGDVWITVGTLLFVVLALLVKQLMPSARRDTRHLAATPDIDPDGRLGRLMVLALHEEAEQQLHGAGDEGAV